MKPGWSGWCACGKSACLSAQPGPQQQLAAREWGCARREEGDDGVQTAGLELLLESALDLAGSLDAGGLLLLDALALLLLNLLSLGLPPAAESGAVVGLVPLPEGSSVNLDDGRLGQGVGADKFVVRRVVGDDDDAGLAGDTLGGPGEVAGVETEGTELAVATTGADKVDTLGTDTGLSRLATLLESPLLAVVCSLSTGSGALVTRITRDTHVCGG